MPTKSTIQDKIEKYVAQQKARTKNGPARVALPTQAEFFEIALVSPTVRDLAGHFGVTQQTIRNWMKKHGELEAIWNRAKALDHAELAAVERRKALDGSHAHLKSYRGANRPDLIAPDSNITINQSKTTVKVLGEPPKDGEFKPFKVIDGESLEVTTPEKPKEETSGLPLFGGRILRPR